jgi:hypothetical protein
VADGFGHAYGYVASGLYTIVLIQFGKTQQVFPDQLIGAGAGSSLILQTNGVPNTVQSLLNIKGSGQISVTADGAGGVTISGGGAAAGADTQIQYNSTGVFAASSAFAWDYTNSTLLIGSDSGTSQDTGIYLRQISNDDNGYTVLKTSLKCENTAAGDDNSYTFWSAQYQETGVYGPQSIEGISLALNHTATDTVSTIQAFTANIFSSTSGSVANVFGVNVSVVNDGAGTMGSAVVFLSNIGSDLDYGSPITTAIGHQAEFTTHGGNLGTARGVQTHVNLGRGGITQYAGLYVEAATNELQGTISSVQVSGGVLTIVGLNPFGFAQVNDFITFYNVGTATFLNGQTVQVTGTTSNTTVVANFSHSNYGPAADTGNFTFSGVASAYFGLYIENQPVTPATPSPYSIWVAGGPSHFGGPIEDSTGSVGTYGQQLSSTVSGVKWVNTPTSGSNVWLGAYSGWSTGNFAQGAFGGNTCSNMLSGRMAICLPASWKVTLSSFNGNTVKLDACSIAICPADSGVVTSVVPVTFNSGSASATYTTTVTTDPINIQVDVNHDYYLLIYFDNTTGDPGYWQNGPFNANLGAIYSSINNTNPTNILNTPATPTSDTYVFYKSITVA